MSKEPGLHRLGDGPLREEAVVVIHGIRQSSSGMRNFATMLAENIGERDIYLADYDWTRALAESASVLAGLLTSVPYPSLSLIGYSMGGLVARFAIADHDEPRVRTIITLATPNRGALSTSQLFAVGQTVVDGLRFISPLLRCQGVMDLTDVPSLGRRRADDARVRARMLNRRFASVPGLYFHQDRKVGQYRGKLGLPAKLIARLRLGRIHPPHDGIVSQDSNNVAKAEAYQYADFDYATMGDGSPSLCHVWHRRSSDLDHISILDSPEMASLVAQLIKLGDWTKLSGVRYETRTPDSASDSAGAS